MDRLTIRFDADNIGLSGDDGTYYSRELPHVWDAIERLAAYEDTGLTPEDFAAAGQMEHFKEWREWHKADAEKRLVVLPCKVGSHVWRVWITDGRKPEITEHDMSDLLHIVQWVGKFGKTVFLTREEAEAALAKEG